MFWKKGLLGVITFTLLVVVGRQVAADSPNVNATPSHDLSVNGRIYDQMHDGFTSGEDAARRAKIAVQNSFSLSLDANSAAGDQAVTSATTSADQVVAIQAFGSSIQNASAFGLRFEYDASQVTYQGFDVGSVLPGTPQVLAEQGTNPTSVTIGIASFGGQATVSGGLVGTIRFRTTATFSGTAVELVRAELSRGGQSETITLTARVSLEVSTGPSPDFDGNGTVGISDFLQFVNHFGTSRGGAGYDAKYDLDGNDAIGISDFLIFVNSFGSQVPPSGGGGSSPDLIVASPSVSDNTLTTGQSFTLRATVRNSGTARSASTTLRYYRSSDSGISTSDTQVGTDSVSGLSASGTSAESISLTAPSSAGTYYYGACVESVSGESDTNNNCSTGVRVTVSSSSGGGGGGNTYGVGESLPNFPSGFFTPRRVSSGSGSASFSYSGGRAVLSFNNGGIIELQDGTTYTCIASGGCGVEGGRVTAGTIRVTTGSGGGGGGGGSPDLVVESPSVDNNSPEAGEYIRLSATVRNQGTGSGTYALTTLRYYQSTDATISTSDKEVGTSLVSRLAAGETSDESDRVRAPSSPGTYYYGACVESVSGESNTNNNCSSAVTVTIGSPDLVVESPSVSNSSPDTGEYFTLSVTVRNQGTGRTSLSLLTLDYYQSTDATISTSDTKVGWDFVSRLAAGETSDKSDRVRAPSSAGTYYYGACIESSSGESNTNNNCSTGVRVTVGGGGGGGSPDLIVASPSVSDNTLMTGQSFTLRATVRNSGTARSASTTLRYYRSSDSGISTSDTRVGTDSVSGLSASGTSAESISLNAPSSAGTYYYGACVESVSGESNTNNNCSDGVRVTVSSGGTPPPSDDAITVSGATCSGTRNAITGLVSVTISGTVQAHKRVSFLTITGYANGEHVGTDILGNMSAGQSQRFSIFGFISTSASTLSSCRVEWSGSVHGKNSQGVVDVQ